MPTVGNEAAKKEADGPDLEFRSAAHPKGRRPVTLKQCRWDQVWRVKVTGVSRGVQETLDAKAQRRKDAENLI